jgi:hypothetical protein
MLDAVTEVLEDCVGIQNEVLLDLRRQPALVLLLQSLR